MRLKRARLLALVCQVALLLSAPGGAAAQAPSAVADEPVRTDDVYVSAGEFMALTLSRDGPERALEVYAALTPQARAAPRVVLAAATALQRLDRPEEAETVLREALARTPGEARLRLEYARLLYEQDRFATARFQFQLALGSRDLLGVERAAGARYLEEIDVSRPWRFSANIALAPDSNINQATSSDTVTLFGLPFALDDSARATSGVGVEAGGSAERQVALGPARLVFSAGGRRREYASERFDDTLAAGGVALEAGAYLFSMNLARRWVADRRLFDVYGVSLARDFQLTPRVQMTIDASVREIDQSRGDFRDGRLLGAGVAMRRALASGGFAEAGLETRRFEAGSASQSYWLGGAVLSVYRDLPRGFGLLAEPTVSYRVHDRGDFFFPDPREDLAAGLRLRAVKRDRVLFNAFPYAEIAVERTWSNQTLYDTERVYGRFGLTRTF